MSSVAISTALFIRPAITEIFKRISPYLIKKAKGAYLIANSEKALNNLEQRFETVLKVRTIYETRKPTHISEFYYPTKVSWNDDSYTINQISDIKISNNLLVVGTIGHGKSMFMRHLTLNEVISKRTLPIFFELRRLKKNEKLIDALNESLTDLFDIEINKEDFYTLARDGVLTLFLDGFDEISNLELINEIIRDLESWATRFPHMRIVCSSRPESSLQNSPHFFPIKICNYDENDQNQFLFNLTKDHDITAQLMDKISTSSMSMQQLLCTPLMLTLFLKTYEVKLKTPLTLSEFYSDLFDVLMNRHDALKAPFNRNRFIDLDDSTLQDIFEEFCLYTKNNGNKLTFSKSYMKVGLEESVKILKLSIDPKNLIEEFTKNICLILQDGNDYSFIHKSIQEFFVANLIKSFDIEYLKEFYTQMRCMEASYEYSIELAFLRELDKLNYTKYYLTPNLSYFISYYNGDEKNYNLTNQFSVRFKKENNEEKILIINFPFDFTSMCSYVNRILLQRVVFRIMIECSELDISKIMIFDIKDNPDDFINDYIEDTNKSIILRRFINSNSLHTIFLDFLNQELDEARNYITTKSRSAFKIKR